MVKEKELKPTEESPSSDTSLPSLTVGIIAAPETPSEIVDQLKPELFDFLTRYVDENIDWKVEAVVDPFTGAADTASSNLDQVETLRKRHDWDYAVSVSDLPFFRDKQFLVAEADGDRAIAQVSLPSLGAAPMVRRVRESILQLVSEMHHGSSKEARDRQTEKLLEMGSSKGKYLRNIGARQLVEKGWFERIAPVHRTQPTESDSESDVRFVSNSKLTGYMRVMIGMIRANHPLRAFSAFKSIIAAAFTTGAFALIFPTLWKFGDVYGVLRSVALMITSLGALTAWMIISHNLWERKKSSDDNDTEKVFRRMYNITTVVTLLISVILYYAILFVSFLIVSFLFIPSSLLESSTGVGHPVGISYHLTLAWIAASLSTWLGAVGAGLADEEKVLRATYGYRQLKRKQQAKKERDEKENN